MTKAKALKDLLAKVEAGELKKWHEALAIGLFPDDRHILLMSAYGGSLDAAKALHEVVLPGGIVAGMIMWDDLCRVELAQTHERDGDVWHGSSDLASIGECDDLARAWLIAILKALIAEEEK